MSSNQTQLTFAELKQIRSLEESLKPECPACSRTNMTFKGTVQLGSMLGAFGVVGTKDERLARRVCGDCGHVMLFEIIEKPVDDRPQTISD